MFRMTFLNQIFSLICFCLQDFTKVVRLLLAAVSINGLTSLQMEYSVADKVKRGQSLWGIRLCILAVLIRGNVMYAYY